MRGPCDSPSDVVLVRGVHRERRPTAHEPSPGTAVAANTLPIWFMGAHAPERPALDSHVTADVCVIGAGIAGLTVAYALAKAHGVETTHMAATSHAAAIDYIEQIVRDESIDCDFTRLDGYLFLGGDDTQQLLDDELQAAHRAGLTGVE